MIDRTSLQKPPNPAAVASKGRSICRAMRARQCHGRRQLRGRLMPLPAREQSWMPAAIGSTSRPFQSAIFSLRRASMRGFGSERAAELYIEIGVHRVN